MAFVFNFFMYLASILLKRLECFWLFSFTFLFIFVFLSFDRRAEGKVLINLQTRYLIKAKVKNKSTDCTKCAYQIVFYLSFCFVFLVWDSNFECKHSIENVRNGRLCAHINVNQIIYSLRFCKIHRIKKNRIGKRLVDH